MGALMVVDPQPAARYQPAEPYINRAAPKSREVEKKIERLKGRTKPNGRNTKIPVEFLSSYNPIPEVNPSLTNTGLKTTKTETNRERVEKV